MVLKANPRLILLVLSALVFPSRATGQELTGRLSGTSEEAPIAGALVALIDSAGRETARALSSPSGGFRLKAPSAGAYRIRVIRIGFLSWLSPPIALASGESREQRFTVEERIIRLADIEVTTTASRCGVRSNDGDIIGGLLGEAEKALALTEQTIRQGDFRFRTETYVTRPTEDGAPGEKQTATDVAQAMWPVQSAPPESLAVWGFVHHPRQDDALLSELGPDRGPVYFGPDARVLFADWFLDGHCFAVVAGSGDSGLVTVEFTPARRSARRDIRGRLSLDRQSLELRRLEFTYTGLPRWAPVDSSGGKMSFRRLASGAWVINEWSLRAPIPRIGRRGDTTFFGFAETGGKVTEIRRGRRGPVEKVSTRKPSYGSRGRDVANWSPSISETYDPDTVLVEPRADVGAKIRPRSESLCDAIHHPLHHGASW